MVQEATRDVPVVHIPSLSSRRGTLLLSPILFKIIPLTTFAFHPLVPPADQETLIGNLLATLALASARPIILQINLFPHSLWRCAGVISLSLVFINLAGNYYGRVPPPGSEC